MVDAPASRSQLHSHPSSLCHLAINAIPLVFAVVARAKNWVYECRLEGATFAFRSPSEPHWITIPTTEIETIVSVLGSDNDPTRYEFVVKGHGRRAIETYVLTVGSLKRFKAAILQENPEIRFTERKSTVCHACGQPLQYLPSSCPKCGAKVPVAGQWV